MSKTTSEFPGWYVNFQAAVLMQLPRPDQIDQLTGEGWTKNQEALSKCLAEILLPLQKGKQEKKETQEILKLISGGESPILDAVDGTETLYEAKDVFVYRDSDFKNYGVNAKGPATPKTSVRVYEMIKDASFAQMFGSLSSDVRKLCLTQAQIKNFVRNYRGWLRTDGWATFFLFESNSELFVASVSVDSDGGLEVDVDRFEDSSVWFAGCRYRLVVPQLAV